MLVEACVHEAEINLVQLLTELVCYLSGVFLLLRRFDNADLRKDLEHFFRRKFFTFHIYLRKLFRFVKVCSLQVRTVQEHAERVFLPRSAHGVTAASYRFVEAAHVPADSHCLFTGQLHKAGGDVDALLTVTVGELVVDGVVGNLFPYAMLVLFVTHLCGVEVHLAQVVQQRYDGYCFICGPLVFRERRSAQVEQSAVDVYRVLNETAGMRTVKTSGCRCCEEVTLHKPVEESASALSLDGLSVDVQELFSHSHLLQFVEK